MEGEIIPLFGDGPKEGSEVVKQLALQQYNELLPVIERKEKQIEEEKAKDEHFQSAFRLQILHKELGDLEREAANLRAAFSRKG